MEEFRAEMAREDGTVESRTLALMNMTLTVLRNPVTITEPEEGTFVIESAAGKETITPDRLKEGAMLFSSILQYTLGQKKPEKQE